MTKLSEFHRFDGNTSGFLGVVNAIKWIGIKQSGKSGKRNEKLRCQHLIL